jgi:hypothetical protein
VVVAQGLGYHWRGHLENELSDCGDSTALRRDIELAKQITETSRVHGLSRAAARKEPMGVWVGGGGHVGPVRDVGQKQRS